MTLHAGREYTGTITRAGWIQSRAKGTNGLQVDVETADGDLITHVWWVTPKTKERFTEDMEEFGIEAESLRSATFLKYEMQSILVGKEVRFTTKEETYNGTTSIKVGFLHAKTAPSDSRGVEYAVAAMFGGSEEPDTTGETLTDDDILF